MRPARPARSAADEQVAELLRVAKRALGLSLTFLSRLDGTMQHLEVVESTIPLFRDGQTQPQQTSFCQAILDGRLPPVIPNVAKLPEAKRLPAARFPRIRSFVSVPVRLSDGELYGTFCAAGFAADRDLCARDQALMEVLASAAATVIEPGVRDRRRSDEICSRLAPVVDGGGPTVLLQAIVSLDDGRRVGAEALSRFPIDWGKGPDTVFDEAASVGLGLDLELTAVERALGHLATVPGYVAINFSPATLLDPRSHDLLSRTPADRVVIELSEHDPVEDYDVLAAALAPHRARGMRLAIDDVGAGFSSLRHIVLTAPDIIKLDRSIVAGASDDPVLRTLTRSLAEFAGGLGAKVVAEGIETVADAVALREAGVHLGQGWLFARPCPPLELAAAYPVAGLHPAGDAITADVAAAPLAPLRAGHPHPASGRSPRTGS